MTTTVQVPKAGQAPAAYQVQVKGLTADSGGYLLGFGTFSLLAETIVDFGFWKAVARGTTITNLESLASVRATDEDPALVGEGLADALNVGSF